VLAPLGVREWAVVVILSILPAALGQAAKLRRRAGRPVRAESPARPA
jgi:hypothetical protein